MHVPSAVLSPSRPVPSSKNAATCNTTALEQCTYLLIPFIKSRKRIATMSKPSKSVLCRDEAQGSSNGFLQVLMNASACSPQKGLQFGESLLNRREIG